MRQVAAGLILLTAACGGSGAGALTATAGRAGTVTVDDADSGRTVHLGRGQHLRVRLTSGTWAVPASSDDGVAVRRTSSGGYPTHAPVDATFDAVGEGSADVTASSDAACFHTVPRCLMAARQWQVRVVVA